MSAPRAVVFDLGGTLVQWSDWEGGAPAKWGLAFDAFHAAHDGTAGSKEHFVAAMRVAEKAHWERVDRDHWSGPATSVLSEGPTTRHRRRRPRAHRGARRLRTRRRGLVHLRLLRRARSAPAKQMSAAGLRDYRLGLLSNTWWAAEWHNADLAAHGLAGLLDELVYTSDLPHSKPHPSVFREVASRLGVVPAACVMIGDRQIDDVQGARAVGMRAIWRRNDSGFPTSDVTPDATVDALAELPSVLRTWGGA